jgi:hypothetical protein
LPVREPSELRAVCEPSFVLGPADQGPLHEDLSAVQGADRIHQMEVRIRRSRYEAYARELLTGHAGCGKSTELLRLADELRKPKPEQAYHVVYLDAYEYMNPSEVRLPQLIVALLLALAEEPMFDLQANRPAMTLAKQIGELFGAAKKEIFKDLVANVPVLKSLLRIDVPLQRAFRERATAVTQRLIELARETVQEVTDRLPAGHTGLVFVIDNLEKIPNLPTETKLSLHEALFHHELPLLDLPAHLVLTYPISLNYGGIGLRQLFRNAQLTTIPMVGVRERPDPSHGGSRADDPRGLAALRRLIARRVDVAAVFDGEATLDEAIRMSGGCVRDLLRFVSDLPIHGDPKFTVATVHQVVADYTNEYERLLQGKPYLRLLHDIERTGAFPEQIEDEWKRQLLLGLVVLEYDTGTWYDIHPLVKRTRAFRLARPADG